MEFYAGCGYSLLGYVSSFKLHSFYHKIEFIQLSRDLYYLMGQALQKTQGIEAVNGRGEKEVLKIKTRRIREAPAQKSATGLKQINKHSIDSS